MTTATASGHQTGTQSGIDIATVTSWGILYRIASVATVIIIGFYLLDIALVSVPGGSDNIGEFTIIEWFEELQNNRFMAMRNLGIFNVITLLLNIPVFAAWYCIHRQVKAPIAGLAALLGVVGIAIYVTNNPAMALLHLSDLYADTSSDSERTELISAARALLAQGEDFAPGAFVGFAVPSLATMLMAWVMLQAKYFQPVSGWLLLVGTTFLLIYTTVVTFIPELFDAALPLAAVGGLMAVAGYATVAAKLWYLGGIEAAPQSETLNS